MSAATKFKENFRKKILINKTFTKFLDSIINARPSCIIFILFFIATSIYTGSLFSISFEFSLFSLAVFLVMALFIGFFINISDNRGLFQKLISFLFNPNGNRYGFLKGLLISNSAILLMYFFIFDTHVLLFEPYFIYFYSIGYLFFNLDLKPEESLKIKNNAIMLFALSFIFYLMNSQEDPLYASTAVCFFPFLITSLFIKKKNSLYLLYRTAFFILIFFISTTIFLHFLIIALLFFWSGKFFFFIKYNLKYPSFYNSYDRS